MDITQPEQIQQKKAEITRFGAPIKPPDKPSVDERYNKDEIVDRTRKILTESEFKVGGENGEDEEWLGFSSRGGDEYPRAVWDKLADQEEAAIKKGTPMPEDFEETFKVCVDIPPTKIPAFMALLSESYGGLPYIGKMAKGGVLDVENFPNIVLYIRGTHLNEILDFSIALSKATKSLLGPTKASLKWAQEVEPDSGVFLTQGDFRAKQEAERVGNFGTYYSTNGAFFKETEEEFQAYLQRRRNQFVIEESLYDYKGVATPSEMLRALHEDAFLNVTPHTPSTPRSCDVIVGRYIPPHYTDVPKLLEACDGSVKKLLENSKFRTDNEYAVRTASLSYMLYMLVHPFENGNGQACTNLISSMLFDGGHKNVYLTSLLDGRILRGQALGDIQTTEAPDSIWVHTIGKDETEDQTKRRLQKDQQLYARKFIELATGELWPKIEEYVNTGKFPNLPTQDAIVSNVLSSLLYRVNTIDRQLQGTLKDTPTGARDLTFGQLQQAADVAEKLP